MGKQKLRPKSSVKSKGRGGLNFQAREIGMPGIDQVIEACA
jgi:hypothetical protein